MHKQRCETCDKAFWPRQSGGRSQVFCSAPCRLAGVARHRQLRRATERNDRRAAALLAAQNGTTGTRCPVCSTMFAPLRSDGQYCSRKCRERVYRQRRRANRQQTACPVCGTIFMPIRANMAPQPRHIVPAVPFWAARRAAALRPLRSVARRSRRRRAIPSSRHGAEQKRRGRPPLCRATNALSHVSQRCLCIRRR